MVKLMLLRHGESVWNGENRFTGWTDVDLSEKGVAEAKRAGEKLKNEALAPDVAFTSVLKRAVRTLEIVLQEMHLAEIPVTRSWRLNERHYGALQGLNKQDVKDTYGEQQVALWRRGYDERPPEVSKDDPRYPGNDPLYRDLKPEYLPLAESLKDTVIRVMPCWYDEIAPALKSGRNVLVVAHGNTLRALVKQLESVSVKDIVNVTFSTGVPLVYELNEKLVPTDKYCL